MGVVSGIGSGCWGGGDGIGEIGREVGVWKWGFGVVGLGWVAFDNF